MAEHAAANSPDSESLQQLVGPGEKFLAIATDEGSMNAGTYDEWLAALRERQAAQKNIQVWIAIVSELGKVCREWLALQRSWAKEIAVRFNAEPASVSLYVVANTEDSVTIETRRKVADMGLLLGGGFGVRAEARITTKRPENHTFIVE